MVEDPEAKVARERGSAEAVSGDVEILVVAATRAEAAHVSSRFEVLITGIGKVAAAAAVASALSRVLARGSSREPSLERARRSAQGSLQGSGDGRRLLVVNLGTAGALRDDVRGLCMPSRVLNHDISAEILRGMGYPVEDDLAIDGGDGCVLATGDAFVTDEAARAALARRAALVDMEGFAVAHACETHGVACKLVKHISDNADASALAWADRVDASARVLGAWLEGFAP